MNPLLKFVIKRIGSKLDDLHGFADEIENPAAFDAIVADMEDYFRELKAIVEEVVL